MSKTALLLLAQGCEETEITTTYDILVRGKINVVIASISDDLIVTCSRGMRIVADTTFDAIKENFFDAVILPGGVQGAENLGKSEKVIERLKLTHSQNGIIAAICASPALVLQQNHLFPEAKMTGYPSTQPYFIRSKWVEQRVYFDDNYRLLTSQGPATTFDFALELLHQLNGKTCAHEVASQLILPEGVELYLS